MQMLYTLCRITNHFLESLTPTKKTRKSNNSIDTQRNRQYRTKMQSKRLRNQQLIYMEIVIYLRISFRQNHRFSSISATANKLFCNAPSYLIVYEKTAKLLSINNFHHTSEQFIDMPSLYEVNGNTECQHLSIQNI